LEKPTKSFNIIKSVHQHNEYVSQLKNILGSENVIELSSDENYPDCCFIEDTCIIAGNTILFDHLGHPSRRGEILDSGKKFLKQFVLIPDF